MAATTPSPSATGRPTDPFDAALRAHGVRATPQRRLVLHAVSELGHATPEQVLERVQAAEAGVSLSTVYRALELLEHLGLVAHTHLGHGAPTYHPAEHADHVHLVCRGCGSVEELDVAAAAELGRRISAATGFAPDLAHLSVHGMCRGCASAPRGGSIGASNGEATDALDGLSPA